VRPWFTSLFAAGTFVIGESLVQVARWDGKAWNAVGTSFDNRVWALCVHDDGSGPALYSGGLFASAGGVPAICIAKWDGSSWSPLGSGLNGAVRALTTFDDGNGPVLVAGGEFTAAGGLPANRIAMWDGVSWSPAGGGMNFRVHALVVFDDGSGPALHAGGEFTTADGVAAEHIARWDGATWSEVGGGISNVVQALTVYDDGNGSALYVGGHFSFVGGMPARNIARWDGSAWSTLGTGVGEWSDFVFALAVHDEGTGPLLFAAGAFDSAGGHRAKGIASWNGSSWAELEGSTDACWALASYDDGTGPALFAGRTRIGYDGPDRPGDDSLARWACADRTAPTISCPPAITQFEFWPAPSGTIVTFSVAATDDRDPTPLVECVPPSGSVFPYGTTLVTCTAIDRSGNPATCQFPVTVERARPIRRQ
jgi:hypothetical protein